MVTCKYSSTRILGGGGGGGLELVEASYGKDLWKNLGQNDCRVSPAMVEG